MVDHKDADTGIVGLKTPAGIRVDVVAREPVLIDPVGMTFSEDGVPYVLEWREATEQVDTTYDVHYQDGSTATVNRKTKNTFDVLKQLIDADGDGVYEASRVVMDDLEYPSTVLIHGDWMYFPSVGHVIRRKSSRSNGTYDITEEILRGMCGYHHHQVSGLTLAHDGWLYTTTGDDDNRAEGSDGSRATVLRTGAIFRSRPDGSQLSEFARGFRNPYRSVVFDELFNMFHVDNDQEDGSKFQGVRLMHLLEGADYGWRLEMGAKCCRTDFERGAVFGERPGKMPSMLKVGRGAPAGLLIYQQPYFPDFFRGLLIYPDCYRRNVRAYRVERDGSSFRVVEQFVLMEAVDDLFRPVQAMAGPDGGIYILDWRTDSGGAGKSWGDGTHGRLYRLSWAGTEDTPAIPLGSRKAWSQLAAASIKELKDALQSQDFELRKRSQQRLLQCPEATTSWWIELLTDESQPATTRALVIGALSQKWNTDVLDALLVRLDGAPEFEIRRLCAEAIQRAPTTTKVDRALLRQLFEAHQRETHPAVQRAIALALGDLASRLPTSSQQRHETVSQLIAILRQTSPTDRWLFDGTLRALERNGTVAIDQLVHMAGSHNPDDRSLSVQLFTAMRDRCAAEGLDQILAGDTSQLSAEQLRDLIETYRHILVEPPVKATGLRVWLAHHPDAPVDLRAAGLKTLAMIGGDAGAYAEQLAIELLSSDSPEIRQAAIEVIGESRMMSALEPLLALLSSEIISGDEKQLAVASLSRLRAQGWPYLDREEQGIEQKLEELVNCIDSEPSPEVRASLLTLLGQLDLQQAQAPAKKMLGSETPSEMGAAIDVLGTDPTLARELAERYLRGELPRSSQHHLAAALQRHQPQDPHGVFEGLARDIFKGGLKLSTDPSELARIERLVRETGDPTRGKQLFLDVERTQCAKCHRIEGTGGEIGPDLTRVWQTHSVSKVLESIVEPSREIKEGFSAWTWTTRSGQVYTGLKLRDTPREIVLRDASGRDIVLPRDQIETEQPTETSLMPEGTVTQLSFPELIDLLSFLRSEQTQRSLRVTSESAADSP